MIVTYIRLRIEHDAHIENLADKAAGRVYTMSGIDDVSVVDDLPLIALPADEQEKPNGHGHDVTPQMAVAMDSTWGQLS